MDTLKRLSNYSYILWDWNGTLMSHTGQPAANCWAMVEAIHLKTTAQQFVLSAAPQHHLDSQITYLGRKSWFKGIYGVNDYSPDAKFERAQYLFLIEDIDPFLNKVLLLGDTEADRKLAHRLKVDFIQVSHDQIL